MGVEDSWCCWSFRSRRGRWSDGGTALASSFALAASDLPAARYAADLAAADLAAAGLAAADLVAVDLAAADLAAADLAAADLALLMPLAPRRWYSQVVSWCWSAHCQYSVLGTRSGDPTAFDDEDTGTVLVACSKRRPPSSEQVEGVRSPPAKSDICVVPSES
jgi:hypothetical protein